MAAFASVLLEWYDARKRDLPWRRTSDPYAIWVSEIMLQQTQVQTVLPYYARWMSRFPTVKALAAAEEQDVLAAWQGLGYYRRCKLLLKGAQWMEEHGMPRAASSWLKVPGVGRYTAGAIASIAFGESVPVVDGNVQRVCARLTGSEKVGRDLEKHTWTWAGELVPEERPGDWNQALMELGATICRPRNPTCESCPVSGSCTAHRRGLADRLPRVQPPAATVSMKQRVWVPYCAGAFGVRQIPPDQWWAGMWEFPRDTDNADLFPSARRVGEVRHSVTNHRITLEVFFADIEVQEPCLTWHTVESLAALALPAPQRRVLGMALQYMGLRG